MPSLQERYTQSVSQFCIKMINIWEPQESNVSVDKGMINSLISKLKEVLDPKLYEVLISSCDRDRERSIGQLEDLKKILKELDLNELISTYPRETENIVELIEEIVEMFDDVRTFHTLARNEHFKTTLESLDI